MSRGHLAERLAGSIFPTLFERLRTQPRIATVARLRAHTPSEFAPVAAAGYPVVLTDLVPPAHRDRERTLDTLVESCGSLVVEVRVGEFADPTNYLDRRETRKVPLAEFIAGFRADAPAYLGNNDLPPSVAHVLGAATPPFYERAAWHPPRYWVGPAGSITPLHKDVVDNFAVHHFGAKRWILFPVRDYACLYMRHPDPATPDFAASEVDLRRPDLARFPRFAEAVPVEVCVRAGEVLYVPAGWAHFVETLEPSLMLNYWLQRAASPGVLLA